jgi:hypothetical protein
MNLYDVGPTWPAREREQLDGAVAAAYGWPDYTPAMYDDEALRCLLTLNLPRRCGSGHHCMFREGPNWTKCLKLINDLKYFFVQDHLS